MTAPKFELKNGYALVTVDNDEIVIENIKVYEQRKGTGRQLIEMVKEYARELGLPIGLYAEPQDETISEYDLKDFYYSCGFELDPNDCDGKLFIYN
jgi:GNAT superfamily N-acetyltransferase